MKKTLLATLILSSSSLFAGQMIADGVELIDVKEEITGNVIEGHSVIENIKVGDVKNKNFSAATSAITQYFSGYINQNITMTASHTWAMENNGGSIGTYYLTFSLCADSDSCTRNTFTYRLTPGKSIQGSTTTYLTKSFSGAGQYPLVAETTVKGDSYSSDKGIGGVMVYR